MSIANKHMVLLNKLIHGTITDHERWQLEKASLDDPFLADAIEGYYDNDVDVNAIKEIDLGQSKVAKRKIPIWKPLMAAATFLLLLSISFWFMNDGLFKDSLMSTSAESTHAEHTSIEEEAEYEISVNDSSLDDNQEQSSLERQSAGSDIADKSISNGKSEVFKAKSARSASQGGGQNNETAKKIKEQSSYDTELSNSNQEEISEVLPAQEQILNSTESLSKDEEVMTVLEDEVVKEKAGKEAEVVTKSVSKKSRWVSPSKPIHTVKGFVYSKSGDPIPNAQILAAVSNEKTQTNDEGYFVMNVTDMNQNIKAVHADYNSQSTLIAPEVSFNLSEIQGAFSEGSKSLIEMMTAKELKKEYAKILDRHFVTEWNLCKDMEGTIGKRVTMQLQISDDGNLDDIDFIGNVPLSCREQVKNHILEGVDNNIFQGKVATTFLYTYYF